MHDEMIPFSVNSAKTPLSSLLRTLLFLIGRLMLLESGLNLSDLPLLLPLPCEESLLLFMYAVGHGRLVPLLEIPLKTSPGALSGGIEEGWDVIPITSAQVYSYCRRNSGNTCSGFSSTYSFLSEVLRLSVN